MTGASVLGLEVRMRRRGGLAELRRLPAGEGERRRRLEEGVEGPGGGPEEAGARVIVN